MALTVPTEEHHDVPNLERRRIPAAVRLPADQAANDDVYHLKRLGTDSSTPALGNGDVETSPVAMGLAAH